MDNSKGFAEKKKLLIYAHYYAPDTASTGQILQELAEGLLNEFIVTVICVVPSYEGIIEKEYKLKKFYIETINGVKIFRIRVPEFSKEKKISRIKNILSYFWGAMVVTFKVGKQDCVFSISQPPILGGLLGVWGKWIKHAKYIYNIQDLNPEQIRAVGFSHNQLILKLMLRLDMFSCKQSNLIITVGRDLVETLKQRFNGSPMPKVALINNWVDENKIYPLSPNNKNVIAFKKKYNLENKFIIMYSGNVGLYYDLENLLSVIRRFTPGTMTADGREAVFVFVGSGAALNTLVTQKNKYHMDNVVFIPYQKKTDLNYSLNAGDVHWVVNAKGIKGVSCPSKFYGIAASGRPVLGVLEKGSEIRCLIEKINCGLVCEPGDYNAIEKNIQWFLDHVDCHVFHMMGIHGYEYSVHNLTRSISVKKYREEIISL